MFTSKQASVTVITLAVALAAGGCAAPTGDPADPQGERDDEMSAVEAEPSGQADEANAATRARLLDTDEPDGSRVDPRLGELGRPFGGDAWRHGRGPDGRRFGNERDHRHWRDERRWGRDHRGRCAWNDPLCRERERRREWR